MNTLSFTPNTRPEWEVIAPLRLATQADLLPLEWEGEFTHFRQVYAQAYRRMLDGLSLIWVAATEEKGIIGQAFIQLNCDRPELADGAIRAYLYAFRVRPALRGLGLGTYIMQMIEEDLKQRDFQYLTLNVARDNLDAQRLYLRLGYHTVAEEPGRWGYPDDKGNWRQVHEPAWRMEKKLI